jgi:hypothetical protein
LLPGWLRAAESASTSAEKLRNLGLAESGMSGPSILRVLLTFALAVAIAWGAIWLLRRYGVKLPGKFGIAGTFGASPIKPLARSVLPGGITCHVVEAQGCDVLITVTRSGVTSLVLGKSADREKPAS